MEQFEFTKAKIATDRRRQRARSAGVGVTLMVVLCLLTVAMQGGPKAAMDSFAVTLHLLRDGDLQGVLAHLAAGAVAICSMLLLLIPGAACTWAVARLAMRWK